MYRTPATTRPLNIERMRRAAARGDLSSFGDLDPAIKVQVIEAMGFRAVRDAHQSDCPASLNSGYLCQCVPDPTFWTAPSDVLVHRGETWEQRLAATHAR